MKNTNEDLRNHLFEVIEGLKDKSDPMDIERAKAVADVAKQIIESAKCDVAYSRLRVEAEGKVNRTPFLEQKPTLPNYSAGDR